MCTLRVSVLALCSRVKTQTTVNSQSTITVLRSHILKAFSPQQFHSASRESFPRNHKQVLILFSRFPQRPCVSLGQSTSWTGSIHQAMTPRVGQLFAWKPQCWQLSRSLWPHRIAWNECKIFQLLLWITKVLSGKGIKKGKKISYYLQKKPL